MRLKTIVIGLLLWLWVYSLSSCRLVQSREKRDSILLSKIEKRSAQLFENKSDSSGTKEAFDLSLIFSQDTAKYNELLELYTNVVRAKEELSQSNINVEQKAHQYSILFNKQQEIIAELRKGAFLPTNKTFEGKNYHFDLAFSGGVVSLKGTITHLEITNTKTITIKEYVPPSNWQAFKKLWFIWLSIIIIAATLPSQPARYFTFPGDLITWSW